MPWKMIVGNAASVLKGLPEASAHCCITSPPYYGLRDYGVEGQIGLEQTSREYIERLTGVFREVRRVLRDDGTLWIVIGDSYSAQGGHSGQGRTSWRKGRTNVPERNFRPQRVPTGYKPKDLISIPWMLAFALRDDGWYLRQEIIWAKGISGPVYRGGSCMPEAVQDRCTRSFETIFLLAKQERYFFDYEAVKEPAQDWSRRGPGAGIKPTRHYSPDNGGNAGLGKLAQRYKDGEVEPKRNLRSVWHVNPQPFKGAHFAVFPSALIEPMVLAGTSKAGNCSKCGTPWKRSRATGRQGGELLQVRNAVEEEQGNGTASRGADLFLQRLRVSCNCARPICRSGNDRCRCASAWQVVRRRRAEPHVHRNGESPAQRGVPCKLGPGGQEAKHRRRNE